MLKHHLVRVLTCLGYLDDKLLHGVKNLIESLLEMKIPL